MPEAFCKASPTLDVNQSARPAWFRRDSQAQGLRAIIREGRKATGPRPGSALVRPLRHASAGPSVRRSAPPAAMAPPPRRPKLESKA